MKILTSTVEIAKEFSRLIHECSSCRISVAWASVGFDAFNLLVKYDKKIEKMIVGTHFYQTHPAFIERFLAHPSVRFVMDTDDLFHPKIYCFEKAEGEWECVIGSPNLTKGGFNRNIEMAILVTNRDNGAQEVFDGVCGSIDNYWQLGVQLTTAQLEAYREVWQRKQIVLKSLRGKFGDPKKEDADDKGKAPLDVPMLRMTWVDYCDKVKAEKDHHNVDGRLKVIRATGQLFANHRHFNQIDHNGRLQVAGLVEEEDINFLWFGSMQGAGKFWRVINENDENVSLALDLIPSTGPITREMYLGYVEQFKQAFPEGRHGVGTATRLLAMKRPDTFVCLDDRNKSGLCDAFVIGRKVNYEQYWDSIVARIMEATWWNAPPPQSDIEREIWAARAAFLDSLYYDG